MIRYVGIFFVGIIALVAHTSYAQTIPCHQIQSGGLQPASFGAPYSFLLPTKPLLVTVNCSQGSATVQAGSGSSFDYVYQFGYEWVGNTWQQFTLAGAQKSGEWLIGQGSVVRPTVLNADAYVVAYICQWDGAQWKCGCQNAACAQPAWQLQTFKNTLGGTTSSGGGSSSTSGSTSGGGSTTSGGGTSLDPKTYDGFGSGDSETLWRAGDYVAATGIRVKTDFHANPTGSRRVVSSAGDLRSAVSSASPGDHIVLRDGTYGSFSVTLDRDGTASAPIFITPETLYGARLNSASIDLNGEYLHFEGFDIRGGNNIIDIRGKGNRVIQNKFTGQGIKRGVVVQTGAQDAVIGNNYFENTDEINIFLPVSQSGTPSKRTRIHNNVFTNISRNSKNVAETMHLGQYRPGARDKNMDSLVEYNFFKGASGEDETIGFKSNKNHVRRNLLVSNNSHMSIRGGNDNIIEENIFIDELYNICVRVVGVRNIIRNNFCQLSNDGGSHIVFFNQELYDSGGENYAASIDNQVINNTFVGGSEIVKFQSTRKNIRTLGRDNVLANNIFVLNDSGDIFEDDSGRQSSSDIMSRNTFENNILWSLQGAPAGDLGGSNQKVDPQLQYNGLLGYPGAPAIDRAGANLAPPNDLFLQPRGSAPDIGAFEQ